MTFEQLLQDPFLKAPKKNVYDNDFLEYVESHLTTFSTKVNSLKNEDLKIKNIRYKPSYVKEVTKILVEGLLECLNLYLNGRINEAFYELDSTLTHNRKNFYNSLKKREIDEETNFYRIREDSQNKLFSPQEMFHIPFELRGCVKNQRFSINGFPSLYVSNNLYTCWEELNRPTINDFQAARLQNTRPVNVLDLTPSFFDNEITADNYRYVITWPIIFCCSIKVKNKDDIFKPEYILPQLLLQWVRQNDMIDGIRYFSTNIDRDNSLSEGDFSNFVFPVKGSERNGHCSELSSLFYLTNAVSWQTQQYSVGGQNFLGTFKDSEKNNSISRLEIVKGMVYPYRYSIFSKLETYLGNMELRDITL